MADEKIEIAKLQTDVKWIRQELSNLQRNVENNFKKLFDELKRVNESYSTLRNDVNLANKRTVENKTAISDLGERMDTVEIYIDRQKTVMKVISVVAGTIGVGNLVWLIVTFFKWVVNSGI